MGRRRLLKYGLAGAGLLGAGGALGLTWLDRKFNPTTAIDYEFPPLARADAAQPSIASACAGPLDATRSQTEGPFYTPNTPLRHNLREMHIAGAPLRFEGRVTDARCRPIAGAVVDLWCCDGEGVYDNEGFRLRGHQFTDAQGRFRFETVRPAAYRAGFIWRTPHLHVKVQSRDSQLLTTQLYFPGEARNQEDSIFHDGLLMTMSGSGSKQVARYDFVLA